MRNNRDQIDTSIRIITPENVTFEYRVAGPFRRLPAYLIDLAIISIVTVVMAIGLGLVFTLLGLGSLGFGLILVLWFCLYWFYGGLFEALWNGQTPGKRMMGIRVLSGDGQPINAMQAVLRNIFRVLDAQPLGFYQVGLITALMNDRFQRMGDLACGTMVVVEERHWFQGVLRITEPAAIRLAEQIPAAYRPSATLARAISDYANRRDYFSLPRRTEISQHVGVPLREQFGLPQRTNLDHLLCAVYYHTFITDQMESGQTEQ